MTHGYGGSRSHRIRAPWLSASIRPSDARPSPYRHQNRDARPLAATACGDQRQNAFAISVAGGGFDARIAVEHDAPPTGSASVYCGDCGEVCAYCGAGCHLTLHVQENETVKVTSPHGTAVTHGILCIKGRFGHQHVQNRG